MLKCDLKTSVHLISLLLSERQVNTPLPYPITTFGLCGSKDRARQTELHWAWFKKKPNKTQKKQKNTL